jgi:hypothetical protein
MVLDGNYIALKNQVIKAERRVLKELGFCVHVKHPHKVSSVSFAWLVKAIDAHKGGGGVKVEKVTPLNFLTIPSTPHRRIWP